jgi:hypothetical protein
MGKRATHDIAPIMRAGFANGLRLYAKKKGMTIPEVFCSWLEEDWQAVLTNIARYTVREAKISGQVQHDHKHTSEPVSNTLNWIEELIGDATEGEIAEPVPSRSVLPVEICAAEAGH